METTLQAFGFVISMLVTMWVIIFLPYRKEKIQEKMYLKKQLEYKEMREWKENNGIK